MDAERGTLSGKDDWEDTTAQVNASEVDKGPSKRDRCTLMMLSGTLPGSMVALEGDELVLGRTELADRIDDRGLSRRHARIYRASDGFYVEDLGSKNGTFVNGEQIAGKPRKLVDGDRIHVGQETLLRVSLHDEVEQEAAVRLYEAAVRDPLTRLHNRRSLDERLRSEFAFADRHQSLLAVILLDIDHFKRVNDTFGHPTGDKVLAKLAEALERMVRVEDLVARYGGEEFAVVVRGIEPSHLEPLCERIRKGASAVRVPSPSGDVRFTVSLGVARMLGPDHGFTSPEDLLAAADEALYRAKSGGRDRAIINEKPARPA